jgi:hypothetical protein
MVELCNFQQQEKKYDLRKNYSNKIRDTTTTIKDNFDLEKILLSVTTIRIITTIFIDFDLKKINYSSIHLTIAAIIPHYKIYAKVLIVYRFKITYYIAYYSFHHRHTILLQRC